jgi:hypothetical protein
MLFRIVCDCGHEGLVSSLPRRACCSACGATRLFRVGDGDPIIRKLAAREGKQFAAAPAPAAEVEAWLRAYGRAAPA